MTNRYSKRRQQVIHEVKGGYALVAFATMQQTNDSSAPFVQEANFYYLTGIVEPGWMLLVSSEGKSVLVSPDTSEIERIFDGGLTDDEAKDISGVDRVLTKKEGEALLTKLLKGGEIGGALGPYPHGVRATFTRNPAPDELYERVKKSNSKVRDIRPMLARMRGVKQADELAAIRRAVEATCGAFEIVKKSLNKMTHEYSIEAQFTFEFRTQGLHHAYEPIVASGKNACTLHYVKNSSVLPKNGLVLMDIGARHSGYPADITRTYAVGSPSEREISVHAAVEKAHHEIISLIGPGVSVKEYHQRVDDIMRNSLKSLGLLKKPADYRKYFPHAISHGLGLDVHDPLGAPATFEPGMVLTVEPGIYIPEEGIGVRIEDNILVTESGNENLSADLSTSL